MKIFRKKEQINPDCSFAKVRAIKELNREIVDIYTGRSQFHSELPGLLGNQNSLIEDNLNTYQYFYLVGHKVVPLEDDRVIRATVINNALANLDHPDMDVALAAIEVVRISGLGKTIQKLRPIYTDTTRNILVRAAAIDVALHRLKNSRHTINDIERTYKEIFGMESQNVPEIYMSNYLHPVATHMIDATDEWRMGLYSEYAVKRLVAIENLNRNGAFNEEYYKSKLASFRRENGSSTSFPKNDRGVKLTYIPLQDAFRDQSDPIIIQRLFEITESIHGINTKEMVRDWGYKMILFPELKPQGEQMVKLSGIELDEATERWNTLLQLRRMRAHADNQEQQVDLES